MLCLYCFRAVKTPPTYPLSCSLPLRSLRSLRLNKKISNRKRTIPNSMPQLQRLAVTATQICDRKIDLTREQQHYLNRVLRLQAGDRFIAMDGRGHWWLVVLEVRETGLFASIAEEIAVNRELPVEVTLMAALPKGNGFDEVVRQATELGVASIVPVTSDRTLLKPSAAEGRSVEKNCCGGGRTVGTSNCADDFRACFV